MKGDRYLIETVELLLQQGFDLYLQIGDEDEQGGTGYRQELEKVIQDKEMLNCLARFLKHKFVKVLKRLIFLL